MKIHLLIFTAFCILLAACSFDYGNNKDGAEKPDIVMRNVEYVRVRGGDPLVRFEAEYAERYEEKKIMNLREFQFEQFENKGEEINATGQAGEASIELDSGNIDLSAGVRISVDSEDVTIETAALHWRDKERQLRGNPDDEVQIKRTDGTIFTGMGFFADARERTWEFLYGAHGSYVDEEKKDLPENDEDPDFYDDELLDNKEDLYEAGFFEFDLLLNGDES